MIDELCDRPDKHALLHVGGGHAAIFGPDGSSLAEKLPPEQEGLLMAEIDLGAIGVAKNAADPAGHYSRPDVTRLLEAAAGSCCAVDSVMPCSVRRQIYRREAAAGRRRAS